MTCCCCEFGLSHDICAEQLHRLHFSRTNEASVWISEQTLREPLCLTSHYCRRGVALHTCTLWAFTISFHVAIRSAAPEQNFFPPGRSDGVFLSSSFPLGERWFISDTNRKWVQFGMRWRCSLKGCEPVRCIITPVLQQNKCVQIMCNCVDRVCVFGYRFLCSFYY